MFETYPFCDQPEKSCLKMSDSEWVEHINLKNFRYGLIPRPKAKGNRAEPIPMAEDHHAETEEPERSMGRERFVQEVGFARDQVRA
jgi:hypothetical protein